MTDTKISNLSAATIPLAGTEVLPIVQTGTTVKASVANIQAAPVAVGTTNGIQYLNSSKVPSTSSSFQYDGSKAYNNLTAPPGGWTGIGTSWWVKQSGVDGGFYAIASGSDAGIFMGHNGTLGKIGVSYGSTAGYTPLGFYTSDALRWQLETDGTLTQKTAAKGINFTANTPAAGMTSQLLNWYEEGTWTPSVGGNATYTIQEGYYVRVGDLVYVQCQLIINALGTGSTTTIDGLPFTALNPANSSRGTGSVWYCANLATNVTSITPGVTPNGTTITFGGFTAAGASMSVPLTVFQNGTRFDFSMTYRAN